MLSVATNSENIPFINNPSNTTNNSSSSKDIIQHLGQHKVKTFEELLILYNNKQLGLCQILDFMEKNDLITFQNFLSENNFDLSNLVNYKIYFHYKDRQKFSSDTKKYINFLEILKAFNLSYSQLHYKDILKSIDLSLFNYLLENNFYDFNFYHLKDPINFLSWLNFIQFKKIVEHYNLDIFQTYSFTEEKEKRTIIPSEKNVDIYNYNRSTSTITYQVNLFYPTEDEDIIRYLIEKGLDLYHNLSQNLTTNFFIANNFSLLDLDRLSDDNIYHILKHLWNEKPEIVKKYTERVLKIEKLNHKYHKRFLNYYLRFNSAFVEILERYIQEIPEEETYIILRDICDHVMWSGNNESFEALKNNVNKFLKLYQIDLSNCKVVLYDDIFGYYMAYVLYRVKNKYLDEYLNLYYDYSMRNKEETEKEKEENLLKFKKVCLDALEADVHVQYDQNGYVKF